MKTKTIEEMSQMSADEIIEYVTQLAKEMNKIMDEAIARDEQDTEE